MYKLTRDEKVLLNTSIFFLPSLFFVREHGFPSEQSLTLIELTKKNISKYGGEQELFFPSLYLSLSKTEDEFYSILAEKLKIKNVKEEDKKTLFNYSVLYTLNDIIDSINIYMMDYVKNMSYIGPLRAKVERDYRIQNLAVEEIDPEGNNVPMFLNNLSQEQFGDFRTWLQEVFSISVEVNNNGQYMELRINDMKSPSRNLLDVGFGYSQVFPILVVIWRAIHYEARNSMSIAIGDLKLPHTVVIEQPELHLHPRMQALFADALVKVIQMTERNVCFVIETHSKYIIERIGEQIDKGNVSHSDVNVVLFNAQKEDEDFNYVEQVNFSKDGFLENWPIGFFSGDGD